MVREHWAERMLGAALRSASPPHWPRWLRRMFILTLPVSVPLWLLWCVTLLFVGGLGVFILGFFVVVTLCVVTPIIAAAVWFYDTLGDLWRAR